MFLVSEGTSIGMRNITASSRQDAALLDLQDSGLVWFPCQAVTSAREIVLDVLQRLPFRLGDAKIEEDAA